jgi:hypothetical protein
MFVHGLQGHPLKTWQCKIGGDDVKGGKKKMKGNRMSLKDRLLGLFSKHHNKASSVDETEQPEDIQQPEVQIKSRNVYWPLDFLPDDCLQARILAWGYDTIVTRGYIAAAQNDIFSLARNFLYAYARNHEHGRPIIFVCHSLGGIIVKEVSIRDV